MRKAVASGAGVVLMFVLLSASAVFAMTFPAASGKALTGEPFSIPADLTRPWNVVIVAYEQWQQRLVDTWIQKLEPIQDARSDFAFYEFPTIKKMNPLTRMWIYHGMRSGIREERARSRTVTLHIDKPPFNDALGISDESQIHLFLVDPNAEVHWRAQGAWTLEAQADLQSHFPR